MSRKVRLQLCTACYDIVKITVAEDQDLLTVLQDYQTDHQQYRFIYRAESINPGDIVISKAMKNNDVIDEILIR